MVIKTPSELFNQAVARSMEILELANCDNVKPLIRKEFWILKTNLEQQGILSNDKKDNIN